MTLRVPALVRIVCWGSCVLSLSAVVHAVRPEQPLTDGPPALRSARYGHTAIPLTDGRVLVAGGTNVTGAEASVELFDPVTGAWTDGAPMLSPHSGHTATLLDDGRVLVAGGLTGGPTPAGAEIYDPVTDVWSPAGGMHTHRYGHAAVRLADGAVLVTGGYAPNVEGEPVALADAELFDPAATAWQPVTPMAGRRARHTASLLQDGRVLIAGGVDSAAPVAAAELFEPGPNTWQPAGAPEHFHVRHTATVLEDGRVLLAGGLAGIHTDIYDGSTKVWTAGPLLSRPREDASATLLEGGRVLLAGGYDTDWTASTELFSAETNAWTVAAPLAAYRSNHTATRLASGRVLLVGGYDGRNVIATTEIWREKTADTTPPTVDITRPDGASVYAIGQAVTAAYTCDDDTELVSCTGSTPGGAAIETTEAGTKTFSVTAIDAAGHATTRSVKFKVVAATNTRIAAVSPAAAIYGQRVTLTAVVSSDTADLQPEGAVEFFDHDISLGSAALVNGQAPLQTTAIGVGNRLTAVYRPDGLYASSTSLVLQYPMSKAAAASTLIFSKSPQQYSDLETFEATVTSAVPGQPADSVTFKLGTLELGTSALIREGTVYKARLTVPLVEPATGATGQMSPTPPMGRLATAVVNGARNFTVPNAARALVITREDARGTYDGAFLAWTPSPSSGQAVVVLRATIKDISATAEGRTDTTPGDISTAMVTFYNRETGVAMSPLLPVELIDSKDRSTAAVTHAWTVNIGTANAQTFRVGIKLGGNYARYSQTDDALVTVARPVATGFLAGGGQLTLLSSSGLKRGEIGSAVDFAAGVKYNGSGAGPSGHFQTIVRSGANVYHVKSASSMSLSVAGRSAVLRGKASIYDITTGSILVDSSASIEATLVDGTPDAVAITVRNAAGMIWFSSDGSGGAVPSAVTAGEIRLP